MQFRRGRRLVLAGLILLPAPAAGQGWIVDASAGAAEYDAVAGEVGTVNAIVGVRREGPLWTSFSAGVPLDSAAVPWLAGGAGTRMSRGAGRVEVGIDAAALGFGYRVAELGATGGGATLIGLPFVALARGAARLEGRTGVLHHTDYFDGESVSRTVHDSGLRGLLAVGRALSVAAEGRVVRASEGVYPFAGASVELTSGRLTGWVRGGRWVGDELDSGAWGFGGRMTLPGRIAVRAAYQREAQDPLYWNGSRTSWSIGISRALGPPVAFETPIAPPEAFRTRAGAVVLRLEEDAEAPPSVAGDFTNWQPVPMERRDGVWQATFDLAPGIYHYSFQRADGSWFLPDSVRNRVDDGFGGVNGVLVVVGS